MRRRGAALATCWLLVTLMGAAGQHIWRAEASRLAARQATADEKHPLKQQELDAAAAAAPAPEEEPPPPEGAQVSQQESTSTNNSSANLAPGLQVLELSALQAAQAGFFRHSPSVSVIITVAYTLVFVVGLVGNSFVVAIVCKSPRMRTVTNYFIANLALADILVLLFCLPATLMSNLFYPYVLGLFVCKTVSYLQGVVVGASIHTMLAVTIDRFLAICFPMDWHMSRRMARWTIACIWLFSLAISFPWFLYFTLVPFALDNYSIQVCSEEWPSERWGTLYFVCANLILLYLFPLTVIILCYLGIWYKIERRNIPGDRPQGLKIELIMQKSKLKVVKMMMVVVVVFLLSWFPLYLISARMRLSEERTQWEDWLIPKLMPLAQWLGASNSCINPILYTLFNRKYQHGFMELLRYGCCCGGRRRQLAASQYTNSNNNNHLHHTNNNNHNHNHNKQHLRLQQLHLQPHEHRGQPNQQSGCSLSTGDSQRLAASTAGGSGSVGPRSGEPAGQHLRRELTGSHEQLGDGSRRAAQAAPPKLGSRPRCRSVAALDQPAAPDQGNYLKEEPARLALQAQHKSAPGRRKQPEGASEAPAPALVADNRPPQIGARTDAGNKLDGGVGSGGRRRRWRRFTGGLGPARQSGKSNSPSVTRDTESTDLAGAAASFAMPAPDSTCDGPPK